MSYPSPPGLQPAQSFSSLQTQHANSSLPSKPPPSVANGQTSPKSASASGLLFQPRAVAAHNYTSGPLVSLFPTSASTTPANQQSYSPSQSTSNSMYPSAQSDNSGPLGMASLQNPFPVPGQFSSNVKQGFNQGSTDPDMEAQIAQWQSAYTVKDNTAPSSARNQSVSKWMDASSFPTHNTSSSTSRPEGIQTTNVDSGIAEVVTAADGKQKTVIRQGGGQSWQDPSLLEWDPAHFRLFVGNLAGEVTDDSLLKAFNKYASIQKARVIRDKRTTKSKGYGFVSFADGDDYFQAARDMQGKYIGSHPVLLRKSTTEIRPTLPRPTAKGHKRGRTGAALRSKGVANASGVQKKHSKNRDGLKILG